MNHPSSVAASRLDYSTQLPVSAYFDEALYQAELDRLFARGPRYLGHELMVPAPGDYHALEMSGGARYLKRADDEVHVFSNVCRHRQAIMLEGRGNARHTVCPLHRWAYDGHGKLLGAPRFDEKPCLHLPETPLTRWNGMLFESGRDIEADLKDLGVARDLDFSGYQFHSVEVERYEGNWKTFIEVYLEDYHVVPYHPGLGNFVTCDDLTWQFGDWYSVQKVGITSLMKSGSAAYDKWQKVVREYYGDRGETPPQGAIWLTYYPNIMVEWYPHVLVVSTLIPQGPDKTMNVVEFYYPEEIVDFEREFIEAERAAYMETAIEDDDIGERMDRGRKALLAEGRSEVGPYQSPMEDGMQHFHEFYRRIMQKDIEAR